MNSNEKIVDIRHVRVVSLQAAVWDVVVRFSPEASSVPVTSAACTIMSAAMTFRLFAPPVRLS